MKEPVDHILRPQLPWRTGGGITECGYDASKVQTLTREEYFARLKDLGQQRCAMMTCMTRARLWSARSSGNAGGGGATTAAACVFGMSWLPWRPWRRRTARSSAPMSSAWSNSAPGSRRSRASRARRRLSAFGAACDEEHANDRARRGDGRGAALDVHQVRPGVEPRRRPVARVERQMRRTDRIGARQRMAARGHGQGASPDAPRPSPYGSSPARRGEGGRIMTNAEFAQQCAYFASRMASWAGDSLTAWCMSTNGARRWTRWCGWIRRWEAGDG
jgi:hypothetical protein